MTTMQALSGAGYPGVPSLAITDNVTTIHQERGGEGRQGGQEDTRDHEGGTIQQNEIPMAVSCNRVPVIDGHTETLYAEFPRKVDPREAAVALCEVQGQAPETQATHGARKADHRQDGERQTSAEARQDGRQRSRDERDGGQAEERDRRRGPSSSPCSRTTQSGGRPGPQYLLQS